MPDIIEDCADRLTEAMAGPLICSGCGKADGPDGIYGVACHSDFRAVEGNAQALCSGMPDDSMVLFESAWESRGRLLNVLAHESAHLQLGVNHVGRTAYERFREYEAYEFGCAYQYIPECKRWLR